MRSKRKEHVVPKFPICKSATVKQQHSRIILSEAYCTNECDSKAFEFRCSKKELMNPPQLPVCPSVYLSPSTPLSLSLSVNLIVSSPTSLLCTILSFPRNLFLLCICMFMSECVCPCVFVDNFQS